MTKISAPLAHRIDVFDDLKPQPTFGDALQAARVSQHDGPLPGWELLVALPLTHRRIDACYLEAFGSRASCTGIA
jgi:hypothetical protein